MKKLIMWNQDKRYMDFAKSIYTYFKKQKIKPLVLNAPFVDENDPEWKIHSTVKITRYPAFGKYVGVAQIDMDNPDDNGEKLVLEFWNITDILAIAWALNTNVCNEGFQESIERYIKTGVYKDE